MSIQISITLLIGPFSLDLSPLANNFGSILYNNISSISKANRCYCQFSLENQQRPLATCSPSGERLNNKDFKTFKIDKNTKIMEFKVKDARGNWRAVSTMMQGKYIMFSTWRTVLHFLNPARITMLSPIGNKKEHKDLEGRALSQTLKCSFGYT